MEYANATFKSSERGLAALPGALFVCQKSKEVILPHYLLMFQDTHHPVFPDTLPQDWEVVRNIGFPPGVPGRNERRGDRVNLDIDTIVFDSCLKFRMFGYYVARAEAARIQHLLLFACFARHRDFPGYISVFKNLDKLCIIRNERHIDFPEFVADILEGVEASVEGGKPPKLKVDEEKSLDVWYKKGKSQGTLKEGYRAIEEYPRSVWREVPLTHG